MTKAKTIVYFEVRGGCCGQAWEEKIVLNGTFPKEKAPTAALAQLAMRHFGTQIRLIKILHST